MRWKGGGEGGGGGGGEGGGGRGGKGGGEGGRWGSVRNVLGSVYIFHFQPMRLEHIILQKRMCNFSRVFDYCSSMTSLLCSDGKDSCIGN